MLKEPTTKKAAKKRISQLRKAINHHRYRYHVLDEAEISDAAFDSLKHELQQLEERYPDLITADSPTQRVGGEALDRFTKVAHERPMLSIEDVFRQDDVFAWEDFLKRRTDAAFDYFCEVKVDGLALALRYENGILTRGVTRGNGRIGEDVTGNIKTIDSVPLRLDVHETIEDKRVAEAVRDAIAGGAIEVRGEVYIEKKEFERLNKKREKRGETLFANPRNLAAGSVRQLDPKLAASRPLAFIAYDIVTDFGQTKHDEEHTLLKALGFYTDPTARRCKRVTDVIRYREAIEKKREKLPYEIDGVVISVNDNALFDSLGVAGKSPRAIRAFKFSPKQAATVLQDIKVQVGRTGAITPIALLEPVEIAGVTVSRATLHNEDEIERLDVRVGDTVVVERAGDVIPDVVSVVKELRPRGAKKFVFPKKCPRCETPLARKAGEVIWRCPNPQCESRKHEYLNYFVSKKAFDIEGMGKQIIAQLMDSELIADPVDIFTLRKGDLEQLERFGEKSAQNSIDAIVKSKTIPLARFINALNIRYVGEETAIDLARHFGSIKALQNASYDDLVAIDGIGEIVAQELRDWFAREENCSFVARLLDAGIVIEAPKRTKNVLQGKTFVFTGSMEALSREEAEKRVRELGGHPASSVSKSTDYVVAGDSPGSKVDRARELGVSILSEKEFLKKIGK